MTNIVYKPEVSSTLAKELGGTGIPIRWDRLPHDEIAELVNRTNAVLIPVGATEQHSIHMGLCVDQEIANHVCLGVSALTGAPVIPPIMFGSSASHGTFPGTLSLQPETLIALLMDIVDSLYASGIRQFIFINAHSWDVGPSSVVADKTRIKYDDARVRSIFYCTMYPGNEIDGHVTYGRDLMHANYFETSLMLYIDPDVVQLDKAKAIVDHDTFWDYRTDQVSQTGVWGRDVKSATAAHGKVEMARCIQNTARAVSAALHEPWPIPQKGE
ncbi:MAG: creatininase family protein [Bifidobacterium tibiigranuli]|jgi:creatinine amidohydrolase|uniref:creatininase family protein n=1 Tax=Bifidobacterium tibiigranuli TaxID=2172043 RepID=UPI0026EFC3AB|nr:creatininase family protein [Bifidobacterium tibiigranuli]MCI1674021.1 creatininase family protein [Bifidobacterium tibiigranuli]MCI1714007.1 creatininase family protein [Bifidobacterium tibiigranuli]MCI1833397.1 creatininase family protein [Bifidobacterium tibiigranuli]